jgi:hypothetical protein
VTRCELPDFCACHVIERKDLKVEGAMDYREKFVNLEISLIELEYAITDLEYERECQATLYDAAHVALTPSKLASVRRAVELGLAALADVWRREAEVVAS